jgi:hypothetical protein
MSCAHLYWHRSWRRYRASNKSKITHRFIAICACESSILWHRRPTCRMSFYLRYHLHIHLHVSLTFKSHRLVITRLSIYSRPSRTSSVDLSIYTGIPLMSALTNVLVKIIVKLLSTLAATKQVRRGRLIEATLREKVLELVEGLVVLHTPGLQVSVTSRYEADIIDVLEPLAFRSISLHGKSGQDITEYVKSLFTRTVKREDGMPWISSWSSMSS